MLCFLVGAIATNTTKEAGVDKEEVVPDKDASVEVENNEVEESNNRDKNTEEEIVPEHITRPDSKLIVILHQ